MPFKANCKHFSNGSCISKDRKYFFGLLQNHACCIQSGEKCEYQIEIPCPKTTRLIPKEKYTYFLYFTSKSLSGIPGKGNIVYVSSGKIKTMGDIEEAQEYIRNTVTHTKGVALQPGSVTISNIVLL